MDPFIGAVRGLMPFLFTLAFIYTAISVIKVRVIVPVALVFKVLKDRAPQSLKDMLKLCNGARPLQS